MDNKVRTSRVDWDHWLNMTTVSIGQAVALSLGKDPDKMSQTKTCDGWKYLDDSFKTEEAKLTLKAHLNNLLEIRESAVEDRNWSAETARGKAAGLHTGKAIMSIETGREEDRVTVIELVAGTRED